MNYPQILIYDLVVTTSRWQLGWFDIFRQSKCSKTIITRWLWSRFSESRNCKNTNWPDIYNWADDAIIQFTSQNFSSWWNHRWLISVISLPNAFMFREIIFWTLIGQKNLGRLLVSYLQLARSKLIYFRISYRYMCSLSLSLLMTSWWVITMTQIYGVIFIQNLFYLFRKGNIRQNNPLEHKKFDAPFLLILAIFRLGNE